MTPDLNIAPARAGAHHELKQTLDTWQLWGIAVGLGYGYFLTTRQRRAAVPVDTLIEE